MQQLGFNRLLAISMQPLAAWWDGVEYGAPDANWPALSTRVQ
jgi:hypothetical protein